MVRWQPGTPERLRAAALDLYLAQGFESTTAEQIARAVGLTERTFFRHFADKREVLFDGQDLLERAFVQGVVDAPAGASAWAQASGALVRAADYFAEERRPHSRRRQQVLNANASLRERELLKLARLTEAVRAALTQRDVPDLTAAMTATCCVGVFTVAFERWVAPDEERGMAAIQQQLLADLPTLLGRS